MGSAFVALTFACLMCPLSPALSFLLPGKEGVSSFEHAHCYVTLTCDLLVAPPTLPLGGNTWVQCC